MRFIAILLVAVIAMPPLPAAGCDMGRKHATTHHMNTGGQDTPKCCDRHEPVSPQRCCGDMLCGFFTTGVSVIPAVYHLTFDWSRAFFGDLPSGIISPGHSPPLYRPPIS